jgi:glucosyl-dolichyl phosphate glucuronosyltransferase
MSIQNKISLSVIIPTCDRPELFQRALIGVVHQNLDKKKYEIIVADNGDAERVDSVVTKIRRLSDAPPIGYFHLATQGVNKARNEGVVRAHGDIIAFCDDDVIVSPTWLINIVDAYKQFPFADVIGGKVDPIWPRRKPLWITQRIKNYLAVLNFGEFPVINPQWLVSANLTFKRDAFRKFGVFNESLGRKKGSYMYKDEIELLDRIRQKKGEILYVPSIVVQHVILPERLTLLSIMRRIYWEGRSEAKTDEILKQDSNSRMLSIILEPFSGLRRLVSFQSLLTLLRQIREVLLGAATDAIYIIGYIYQRINHS